MHMIHRLPIWPAAALLAIALAASSLAGCESQEKETSVIPHKKMEIKKRDNRYERDADSDNDPATTDFLR